MKIEMHVHTSEGSSCAKAEAQERLSKHTAKPDMMRLSLQITLILFCFRSLGRRMSRRSNGICLVTVRRGKPENDMELK